MNTTKRTKQDIKYLNGIINNHNKERNLYQLTDNISKRIKNFLENKQTHDIENIKSRIIQIMQKPPTRHPGEPEESFLARYYDRHNKQENYENILRLLDEFFQQEILK